MATITGDLMVDSLVEEFNFSDLDLGDLTVTNMRDAVDPKSADFMGARASSCSCSWWQCETL